ncbi:hypothetical protein C0993_000185 [Termitomyces sp. T159_Od127]|nr:hypothetical protein C0993_000185 [Termitomyces sp. T159_Od127]
MRTPLSGYKTNERTGAYTSKELRFQYEDSGAKLVFVAEDLVPVVFGMFKLLGVSEHEAQRRVVVLENGLEWAGGPPVSRSDAVKGLKTLVGLMNAGGKLDHEERFDGKQANETVYLCYSSGTTGNPKGVETTHLNINSVQECLKPAFPKLSSDKDLMLAMLPFYHIYGNSPLFSITTALIVPPVLVVLARHAATDKYDMSSLKTLVSGAAPLGPDIVNQVQQRLNSGRDGKDECVIIQGYGLTETSPTTHFLPAPDGNRKVGSIGILLPNLEARLVDDGDGDVETKEGEPGELWIRGPIVMKGYLNNAAATKASITHDGWFKTGDIAIRDQEGYYYIVDRKKELIKYKGFQVPPAELEGLMLSHPDIADAAVIGVYSESQATELPRAYVVHAHPEQLRTEADTVVFQQEVRKWTQERVARHKFLRGGVIAIDVIPKSASGKILRRELRERAKLELEGQDPGSDEIKAKL